MGQLNADLKIYDQELSKKAKKESCCSSPCCWYNPPQDSLLVEYFQETYLHGLKFVAQPSRHLLERIFWSIAFIAGVVAAGYLISDVWRKYQTSPVILAFNPLDLSISEIQFPAVTICNINKVQKSFAEKVGRRLGAGLNVKAQQDYYVMNSVCTAQPTFAKRIPEGKKLFFNESLMHPPRNDSVNYVADFLYRASQPCTEMLQRCSWSGTVVDCDKIFFPVITELGICCTFNLMPLSLLLKFPKTFEAKVSVEEEKNLDAEKQNWAVFNTTQLPDDVTSKLNFPRRQFQAGQTHGLSLLLFPDLDNYFCTASDSTGFRVAFHSAIETPHVTEFGMAVPPGTDMYVEVYPEVTMTESIVTQFPVSDRHCYFQQEKELKYYNYYTQLNCIDECESDLHRNKCNCSWFYEPRDQSTLVCVPNNATTGCSACLKEKFAKEQNFSQRCSHCLPLCTQIKFSIQSSLSALLNSSALWNRAEEISPKPNKTPIWLGKPVTILNLYYGDNTVVPKQRKELYGSTDLFANTGGLLGLCLGFSGLSAVEIIYFCTIRLWFRKKGGSRNFRNCLKINFRKLFARKRSSKGHIAEVTYNINVTLQKDQIPFWPPLKDLRGVSRIQVNSGKRVPTADTNNIKIETPTMPESNVM